MPQLLDLTDTSGYEHPHYATRDDETKYLKCSKKLTNSQLIYHNEP